MGGVRCCGEVISKMIFFKSWRNPLVRILWQWWKWIFKWVKEKNIQSQLNVAAIKGKMRHCTGALKQKKMGLGKKKNVQWVWAWFAGVQGLFHAFAHPPLVSVNIFFLWLVRTTNGLRSRFSSGREGIADDQNKTGWEIYSVGGRGVGSTDLPVRSKIEPSERRRWQNQQPPQISAGSMRCLGVPEDDVNRMMGRRTKKGEQSPVKMGEHQAERLISSLQARG